jgi:hypothetical protein
LLLVEVAKVQTPDEEFVFGYLSPQAVERIAQLLRYCEA